MRIGSTALAIVVVLSVVVGVAAGAVQYTVTDLDTLGGSWSRAYGINNSGQVVGVSYITGDTSYHAFRYGGSGLMQDLGIFTSLGEGINSSGQVTGTAFNDDGERAFLQSGSDPMQYLGTLGGSQSCGVAINDNGQVVGWATTADDVQRAFVCRAGGPMQDLGALGGSWSRAFGINNSGQIVGDASTVDDISAHAFLYSGSGPMRDLGTLGGPESLAYALNNEGQIVGGSDTADGSWHAFLSSGNGPMQDLGTLGGINSWAVGINNSGQIVGTIFTGQSGDGKYHYRPFLYRNGTMTDLNSLIDPTLGFTLTDAEGINDKGQIVGYGNNSAGQEHAFLLTPAPEPSTFALLGGGAIGLLGYAWRRKRRA